MLVDTKTARHNCLTPDSDDAVVGFPLSGKSDRKRSTRLTHNSDKGHIQTFLSIELPLHPDGTVSQVDVEEKAGP